MPVYGREGNKISLHCFYSGGRQPITRWYLVFPNATQVLVEMINDTAISITDDSMNSLLTIFPFSQRHAGTYRCNTSNSAGSDTGDVIVECKIIIILNYL